jgi:hypothetical protein
MDILKIGLKHFGILGAVAVFFTAWPSTIHHPRFIVFQKKLTIQTSKLDPPRLAFDEIYNSSPKVFSDWDLLNRKDGTQLGVSDEARKFAIKSPVQMLRNQKIVLQPMRFSHLEAAANSQQASEKYAERQERQDDDKSWMQQLSSRERQRLLTAQEKYGDLSADWEEPDNFKDRARKALEKAHAQLAEEAAKPERVQVSTTREDGTVVTAKSLHTADVVVRGPGKDVRGPYKVSGVIEYSRGAGLPSGSPWQIQVARYQDDVQKEVARVDTKKSTYEIQIPEVSGTLYAHLVNTKTGEVLGEGTFRLSPYSTDQFSGNAKIVIGKSPDYIASNYGAFSQQSGVLFSKTPSSEKPIATRVLMASLGTEGKTDEAGVYRFDQIKKGSWSLLRTEAKDFHPSLSLVRSGTEKRQPLFPETMIQSLKKVIQDQALSSEVPETGSIVWGQVVQNGRPIPGAQVQVESLPNYRAVYFNSLLFPDPELKTTSENGYFAFVHLPSGFHSLLALHGNAYLSHSNVVVDDESISVAELESSFQSEKVEVKIYDGFSGAPEKALIEMQSLPGPLEVKGFAEIHMPTIDRLSLVRVLPEDKNYLECLQVYEDSQDSVPLPLIRQAWLTALMSNQRINLKSDTGVIVGFSQNAEYEVYLGHEHDFSTNQIVYFDTHGNVTSKGEPGGGFVIFNVPQGVQSVVWASRHSDLLQTQVIPVDPSGLVVLKFK